jgi:hypothetical protein
MAFKERKREQNFGVWYGLWVDDIVGAMTERPSNPSFQFYCHLNGRQYEYELGRSLQGRRQGAGNSLDAD